MSLWIELVAQHSTVTADMTTTLGFANTLITFISTITAITLRVRGFLRERRNRH